VLSSDEAAIAAANLAFYEALEARDLGRMERIWLREDSASCTHPGWHRIDGWAEVRRSWQNIFGNSRAWTVSCEQVRISRDGDLAWVTCVEAIRPFRAEGPEATARMQATNLFRRTNGEWRMIHHHASPSRADEAAEEEPVN